MTAVAAEWTARATSRRRPRPRSRSTSDAITIDEEVKLYLFGTPGQDRFGFMWRDLVHGALAALVIVDTRRMDDCYPAVDYFETRGLLFVVAVNMFDGDPATTSRISGGPSRCADDVPLIIRRPAERCRCETRCWPVLHNTFKRARAQAGAGA